MGWYKKASDMDLSDFLELAKKSNVKYNGPQMKGEELYGYVFTDNITGSSFIVKPHQSFDQKLNEIRERFTNK